MRKSLIASAATIGAALTGVAAMASASPASTSHESTPAAPTTHALALPQFAASASGRELLKYVVSCALPEGVQLESAGYRFGGSLGLAPGWLRGTLAEREQRLVSACLLARTNFFGHAVRISMRSARADAPAGLRADRSERARFARLEAGFFGNVFTTPAAAYVCAGDASDGRSEWLQRFSRICSIPAEAGGDGAVVGSPTACGFTYVGLCSTRPFVQAGTDYSAAVIEVYLPAAPAADHSPAARRGDGIEGPRSAAPQTRHAPIDARQLGSRPVAPSKAGRHSAALPSQFAARSGSACALIN